MIIDGIQVNISELIGEAVRIAVDKKAKEIAEKAKAELDAEIPQIVAGVTLDFQKQISLRSYQDEVVITIRRNP